MEETSSVGEEEEEGSHETHIVSSEFGDFYPFPSFILHRCKDCSAGTHNSHYEKFYLISLLFFYHYHIFSAGPLIFFPA